MPKWLRGMVAPTLLLWLYLTAFAIASVVAGGGGALTSRSELISTLALALVVTTWVLRDAQKHGRPLCYDYGTFLFFAWPVIGPVYLFQTRGARALLTILLFVAMCILAAVAVEIAVPQGP